MEASCLLKDAFKPITMVTIRITVITPMTMPSVARMVRTLFPFSESKAMLAASSVSQRKVRMKFGYSKVISGFPPV